jgi:ATP-binding cassette, subfamily C, bacterial CydC
VRAAGRLLQLVRSQRIWLVVGVLLSFLAVATNVALMALSAYLISRAAVVSNVAEIALAITGVRVLAIGRAAFRYLERYVTHRSTFAILTELRVWFFASIEPFAPARLSRRRSGDLLGRIVGDIDTLEDVYVRIVVPPIVAAMVALFGGLLLGTFAPILGVVLVGFMVASGVALPIASARWSAVAGQQEVEVRGELGAMIVDEVHGLGDLLVLDRASTHRAAMLDLGETVDASVDRQATVRAVSSAASTALAGLAGVTVLAIGIDLIGRGQLDGVYLALLPLAAIACFEVIGPLAQSFALRKRTDVAASRLFELIDAPPGPGEVVPDSDRPTVVPDGFGIDVVGLRFRYGPDEPLVLDGLDLTVPSGGSLAIVGPSGSGKSTLVNLLLRFWDAETGEIRVGGRDILGYSVDELREMLGVVAQDVHLFNGTIRDNLAVADADATDDAIEAACRLAQVHAFIETLPLGYETRIGENGLLLSGGERQRIAIARAVIKDAPILVLDEATAGLDVATERDLMFGLAPFIAGRTTIVVSHRPSIAARMDKVIRLEAGRVVR